MEPESATMPAAQPGAGTESGSRANRGSAERGASRGLTPILKSYFYWTYSRGSLHYDVMVTLILLFIFATPHLWDFGERPSTLPGPQHPILVSGNGGRGVIITVQAADVAIPAGASNAQVKRALRAAIEPVTGDDVFVERWETVTGPQGNLAWKVWAHK